MLLFLYRKNYDDCKGENLSIGINSVKLLSSSMFVITLSPISVKVNCGYLTNELFLLEKDDTLLRQRFCSIDLLLGFCF